MDNVQKQLAERLKSANNVLVTVSRNPSVDQLAACLGLTLYLNKLDKHAAAVFSGAVPSTIEFLQPEETLEKNTDSLRDFIIALDKNKADKLRYKVEDDVVRIFITPYKTSISQDDLDFSQGDFNVDVVVALGVQKQEDFDEAITAHGRILHDATVTSLNVAPAQDGGLGSLNWYEPRASSLSELVTELIQEIDAKLLDEQIATALLTGIVAETARFSNDKTSSATMSASAALMTAGANQQLVATKLDGSQLPTSDTPANNNDGSEPPKSDDGTLEIEHEEEPGDQDRPDEPKVDEHAPEDEEKQEEAPGTTPEQPMELPQPAPPPPAIMGQPTRPLLTSPPSLGGTLSANTELGELEPAFDPLSLPAEERPVMLERKADDIAADAFSQAAPSPYASPESAITGLTPPPRGWVPPTTPPAETTPVGPPPVAQIPSEPIVVHPSVTPDNPAFEETTPATPTAASPVPPPSPTPAPPPMPEPPDQPFSATPPSSPSTDVPPPAAPSGPGNEPSEHDKTLHDLEAAVNSPHLGVSADSTAALNTAREEVGKALTNEETPEPPPTPIQALNAQPLGGDLHPASNDATAESPSADDSIGPGLTAAAPAAPSLEEQIPGLTKPKDLPATPPAEPSAATPQVVDATAPPPVPPPIPFQFGSQAQP